MAENKNQHFVPVFYLKNFSSDIKKNQINILLKDKKKVVNSVSIKDQAQSDYFYGKDIEFEKSLSKIENQIKMIIEELNRDDKIIIDKPLKEIILYITFLQNIRTKKFKDLMSESLDKFVDYISCIDPSVEDKIKNKKVFSECDIAAIVKSIPQRLYLVHDLKVKIFQNNSDVQFITSDHPVVKFNMFLRMKKWPSAHTGWPTKGLQIFFPISPNRMIVLYDGNTYKIGNKKDRIIKLSNTEEVESLNKLQLLNADKVIFFKSQSDNEKLIDFSNKVIKKVTRVSLSEIPYKRNDANELSQIVTVYSNNFDFDLKINSIKYLKKAKKYQMGDYLIPFRSEKLRLEHVKRKSIKNFHRFQNPS